MRTAVVILVCRRRLFLQFFLLEPSFRDGEEEGTFETVLVTVLTLGGICVS